MSSPKAASSPRPCPPASVPWLHAWPQTLCSGGGRGASSASPAGNEGRQSRCRRTLQKLPALAARRHLRSSWPRPRGWQGAGPVGMVELRVGGEEKASGGPAPTSSLRVHAVKLRPPVPSSFQGERRHLLNFHSQPRWKAGCGSAEQGALRGTAAPKTAGPKTRGWGPGGAAGRRGAGGRRAGSSGHPAACRQHQRVPGEHQSGRRKSSPQQQGWKRTKPDLGFVSPSPSLLEV